MRDGSKVINEQKDTLPDFIFIPLAALVAFLIINYFFCPRYPLWSGIDLPGTWTYPEVNRAVDAVKQLEHPFQPINNPTNDAIRYRLLFPIIAHYLAIPRTIYLAIPHLGCILTLAWLANLIYRETGSRTSAFIATTLFGTTSWLFISAGWLAYFDSWYMLGLLLFAFHHSRFCLIAVCLLVPWIDERFVLALPIALTARTIYLERSFIPPSKSLLLDILATGLTVLPWLAFRVYLIQTAEDQSPSAIAWQTDIGKPGMLWNVIFGWWNGVRLVWLYALFLGLLSILRKEWLQLSVVVASTAITLILNLRFACDISRASSCVLPFAVLGLLASTRFPGIPWEKTLLWICGLNLALPAQHVITIGNIPIFYYPYQRQLSSELPQEFTAVYHNQKGIEAWQQKDVVASLEWFSAAIRRSATTEDC